jgi:hypothetical protein
MMRFLFIFLLSIPFALLAQDSLDVAYVYSDSSWRLIDKKGNFLTPSLFEHDSLFTEFCSDGMVLMEKGGKYGFYDLGQKKELPCIYEEVNPAGFIGEPAKCAVKLNGKHVLINRTGKELGPVLKEPVLPVNDTQRYDGYEITDINGRTNCIGPDGKLLLVDSFEYVAPWNKVESFLEDRIVCMALIPDKTCTCKKSYSFFGFLNRKGEWVIEPEFLSADVFVNGAALVSTADGYGYIDREGNWLIEPKYLDATKFRRVKIK